MADLNKLTFREFTEAWKNDGGGREDPFFIPVNDILHARI